MLCRGNRAVTDSAGWGAYQRWGPGGGEAQSRTSHSHQATMSETAQEQMRQQRGSPVPHHAEIEQVGVHCSVANGGREQCPCHSAEAFLQRAPVRPESQPIPTPFLPSPRHGSLSMGCSLIPCANSRKRRLGGELAEELTERDHFKQNYF